jgi:hypothetical protein
MIRAHGFSNPACNAHELYVISVFDLSESIIF